MVSLKMMSCMVMVLKDLNVKPSQESFIFFSYCFAGTCNEPIWARAFPQEQIAVAHSCAAPTFPWGMPLHAHSGRGMGGWGQHVDWPQQLYLGSLGPPRAAAAVIQVCGAWLTARAWF